MNIPKNMSIFFFTTVRGQDQLEKKKMIWVHSVVSFFDFWRRLLLSFLFIDIVSFFSKTLLLFAKYHNLLDSWVSLASKKKSLEFSFPPDNILKNVMSSE